MASIDLNSVLQGALGGFSLGQQIQLAQDQKLERQKEKQTARDINAQLQAILTPASGDRIAPTQQQRAEQIRDLTDTVAGITAFETSPPSIGQLPSNFDATQAAPGAPFDLASPSIGGGSAPLPTVPQLGGTSAQSKALGRLMVLGPKGRKAAADLTQSMEQQDTRALASFGEAADLGVKRAARIEKAASLGEKRQLIQQFALEDIQKGIPPDNALAMLSMNEEQLGIATSTLRVMGTDIKTLTTPKETFEPVLGPGGDVIAQRSTTTGREVTSPRVQKQKAAAFQTFKLGDDLVTFDVNTVAGRTQATAAVGQGAVKVQGTASADKPLLKTFEVPGQGKVTVDVNTPQGRADMKATLAEGGTLTTPGAKSTADENKSAGFAIRAENSDEIMRTLESDFIGNLDIGGFLPNVMQSKERQRFEQTKRNFINAVLRRESGAVIAESEFANADRQYFAQPGDSPEVLAQKQANRQTIIGNFISSAGTAYEKRLKVQSRRKGAPTRVQQPAPFIQPQAQPQPSGSAQIIDFDAQGNIIQ